MIPEWLTAARLRFLRDGGIRKTVEMLEFRVANIGRHSGEERS
jgi:hypothetical protein